MEKIFGFKSCFGAYNWGVGVLPKLLEVHSPLPPPPPLSRPGFPSVYPSYCCVLPKILKLSSNYFTTFHQYPGSSPAILVLSYQTCGEIPTGTLRASAVWKNRHFGPTTGYVSRTWYNTNRKSMSYVISWTVSHSLPMTLSDF